MWHFFYNIYHLLSNAFIIILLQYALLQLFGHRHNSNFFINYILSSIVFWCSYYLPFHIVGIIRIPYYYYFFVTVVVSLIWGTIFVDGAFLKKLPYILFYYSAYKCFKFILGALYETEQTMIPMLYQLLDVITWFVIIAGLSLLVKLYIRHPLNFNLKHSSIQDIFLSYYPVIVFVILQLADPSLKIPYLFFIDR